MAIKKTANMSAAPKKVVAKKSDPGKGKMTASQVKADMKKRASKNTAVRRGIEYNALYNQPYQEKTSKNKGERYFETSDGKYSLKLKGFPEQKKKKKS